VAPRLNDQMVLLVSNALCFLIEVNILLDSLPLANHSGVDYRSSNRAFLLISY